MRWLTKILAVALIVWAAYAASPYLAIYGFADAVATRDAAALRPRINEHAIRIALGRQLANAALVELDRTGGLATADKNIAVNALLAFADPIAARYSTPEGMIELFRTFGSDPEHPEAVPPGLGTLTREQLPDLIGSSRARGFRGIYFTLPLEAGPDTRFRLQFRFSRLRWRLIGLELPYGMREKLVQDLVKKVGS